MKDCGARRYSDQMQCGKCGLAWDVNDDDPPECREMRKEERYLAGRCERQKYADERLRRIFAMLES